MHCVSIRELREHTRELLKRVRDGGEQIGILYKGEVIARVVPEKLSQQQSEDPRGLFADVDTLAEEVARVWPEKLGSVDAVSALRKG